MDIFNRCRLGLFKFLSFLFLLVYIIPCLGQKTLVQGDNGQLLEEQLSPRLEKIMLGFDLPGLAIGVVQEGEIIYAKALGYSNLETQDPLTLQSIFHMASISKPFVATAIMQLAERGKLSLDDPVKKYLPYFTLQGESYSSITIRQMLTHYSGMPDVQDYQWDQPEYDEGALERFVKSIAGEKLLHPPGNKFAYSNMAFECLGDVIHKVSGLSFAEYQQQYILTPSGMHSSTFLKPTHLPELWAAPHIRTLSTEVWEGYPYNRRHGPSSTLHSNVLDMCRWAMINMNRGELDGNSILSTKSYRELWEIQEKVGNNGGIGLSWFIGSHRGVKRIGHSGGDRGFNTDLVILPSKKTAVIVMSNFSPAPVGVISRMCLDILLGYPVEMIPYPAMVSVTKELEVEGMDSATRLWKRLKKDQKKGYEFKTQRFSGLSTAIDLDEVEKAKTLTLFLRQIYPPFLLRIAGKKELRSFMQAHPENQAAPAVWSLMKGKTKGMEN